MRWCGLILKGDGSLCPGVLDGFEGCSPLQRLEVLGEVVGGNEGEDVGLEALQVLVVERLHGGVLDGPVHALGLAISPGVWYGLVSRCSMPCSRQTRSNMWPRRR